MSQQNLLLNFISNMKLIWRKRICRRKKNEPAKSFAQLHIQYEVDMKEKNLQTKKKWASKIFCSFLAYIWNKVLVCEYGITIVVQIRLTHQWSSFSRMILWWSDGSASMTVLKQLCSNMKSIVYDGKKKLVEAASSTFENKSYMNIIWKRTNCK